MIRWSRRDPRSVSNRANLRILEVAMNSSKESLER